MSAAHEDAERLGRGGRRRRAIFIVIFAIAVLSGAELLLRIAGYAQPPQGMASDGSPMRGHPYEQRNIYLDATFSDATYNIVVFGGAWAFGLGLARAQTFPALIEKELGQNQRLAVRVVNLAQPDFNSADVLEILPRSLVRYKADLAVIMTGLTDCVPDELKKSYFARKVFSTGVAKDAGRVRLLRLASNIAFASKVNGHEIDPEFGTERAMRNQTFEQTQSNLLAIGKAVSEAGIDAVFVMFPKLEEPGWFHPHYPLYSRRNFLIRSAANNFQMHLVDLGKIIPPDRTSRNLLSWMRWPHLNAEGHKIIADEIIKSISPVLGSIPQT